MPESSPKKTVRHSSKLIVAFFAVVLLMLGLYFAPSVLPFKYVSIGDGARVQANASSSATTTELAAGATTTPWKATHLSTPPRVKGIYITSWVAGRKDLRDNLIRIIDGTEINSVVIDIKDYTGRVAYLTDNKLISSTGSPERRIADIRGLIEELHKKNIYVIGRISTFQDLYLVKKRPDLAVKRKSDGGVWGDRKGISWFDAGAKPYWEYVAEIGKDAYVQGFDELQFDYIRFPSDGNMTDIAYPYSGTKPKHEVLASFFEYLHDTFKSATTSAELGGTPVISADLFGMTTTNKDDLGIGQVLEDALPNFDYVSPMVYPSHYPPHFMGFLNPADKPYEVIQYSMSHAVARAKAASTTPAKLRPWLQDFNLGAKYTADMVRAQIKATNDVGLDSWLLWNASNRYTEGALLKE